MPRPAAPPTPQPSTEIASKSDASLGLQLESFALPPAALPTASKSTRDSSRSKSISTASNNSDSSYHPMSPPTTSHSKASGSARKRNSSATKVNVVESEYSLPPPPTRARKIIQMKPKPAQSASVEQSAHEPSTSTSAGKPGGRKKQGSGNTAAGRKIARKTAHSLIERRRRSKMNEEFATLKHMIPACVGQEMHKLAILQASIEYMRYLETCVTDLKASRPLKSNDNPISYQSTPNDSVAPSPAQEYPVQDDEAASSDDEDQDMEDADAVSPTTIPKTMQTSNMPTHHSASTSPAIYPVDRTAATYSGQASPVIQPSDPRHYSITSSIRSTQTSPNIEPSPSIVASPTYSMRLPSISDFASASATRFILTSPALKPIDDGYKKDAQREKEDQEATAALLMLNNDRRSWKSGRALGVKDLLSN